MFDFDAGKLLIIGVVALIVIGPKDLPRVLRQVGQAVGKVRRMAAEFQGQFMDAMKEADLQDIRSEVAKLTQDAKLDVNFDPVREVQSQVTQAVSAPISVPAETSSYGPAGFAIPDLAQAETPQAGLTAPVETETETLASAGLAPTVGEAAEAALDQELAATRKRKVVVTRRRAGAPLSTSDRLALAGRGSAARFRNVRPRRSEVTEP